MARVDFPEGINPFAPLPQRKNEEGKKTGKGKGVFRSSLAKALEDEGSRGGVAEGISGDWSEGGISDLLDAVHEAGDRLKDKPGVAQVQAYKGAVRNFVHHVVEHAWSVEKKTSGGNILKRKEFYRLAVIDESLEKLAAEILRNQRDRLEILRRIDEINGMLVDLLR
ncbi:MAG TPA: YaaR family protein [Rectinemataceae bacterium]|nr:YaaR family protein [Rectinemataceae bacterium]